MSTSDEARPDGIRLGLLKDGCILTLQYSDLNDDCRVILEALGCLARRGQSSTVEARGVATRLVTVHRQAINWDDMPGDDRRRLEEARVHAKGHAFGPAAHPDYP